MSLPNSSQNVKRRRTPPSSTRNPVRPVPRTNEAMIDMQRETSHVEGKNQEAEVKSKGDQVVNTHQAADTAISASNRCATRRAFSHNVSQHGKADSPTTVNTSSDTDNSHDRSFAASDSEPSSNDESSSGHDATASPNKVIGGSRLVAQSHGGKAQSLNTEDQPSKTVVPLRSSKARRRRSTTRNQFQLDKLPRMEILEPRQAVTQLYPYVSWSFIMRGICKIVRAVGQLPVEGIKLLANAIAWSGENSFRIIKFCLLLLTFIMGFRMYHFVTDSLPLYVLDAAKPIVCSIPGSSAFSLCHPETLAPPPRIQAYVKEELRPKLEAFVSSSRSMQSWPADLEVTRWSLQDISVVIAHSDLPHRGEFKDLFAECRALTSTISEDLTAFLGVVSFSISGIQYQAKHLSQNVAELASAWTLPSSSVVARFYTRLLIAVGGAPDPVSILASNYRIFISLSRRRLNNMIDRGVKVLAGFDKLMRLMQEIREIEATSRKDLTKQQRAWRDQMIEDMLRLRWAKGLGRGNANDHRSFQEKIAALKDVGRFRESVRTQIRDTVLELKFLVGKLKVLEDEVGEWEKAGLSGRAYDLHEGGIRIGNADTDWFPVLDIEGHAAELGAEMSRLSKALNCADETEGPGTVTVRQSTKGKTATVT